MARRCGRQISIVLCSAVLLAGCSGGAATATPTPSDTRPVALPAGTYNSVVFAPRLTFTLPDGWWIASDEAGYLALQPVSTEQMGIFLFRDPSAASQDVECPLEAATGVGGLSTELSAWIRALPGLTVVGPRLASVGGLRGTEMDLRIINGWQASCPFADGLPTVPLFARPADELRWVVAGSETLRLSLLDVPGGGTVVVDIDAFDGSLTDALLQAADPIVASFQFAGP